jgi:hypothetical protein
MFELSRYSVLVVVSLTFFGCGGGSSSTEAPTKAIANIAPKVDAGVDQTVSEANEVSLLGSGSDEDGSIASYSWTQLTGTTVELVSENNSTATFLTPNIDTNETLTFKLEVTDNEGMASSDTVDVTVTKVNQFPIADAGADQTISELNKVYLIGSGTDTDGSIASYRWSQITGKFIELISADEATATFIAPDAVSEETLTFQFEVTDNEGMTSTDIVIITVQNVPIISGSISYDNVEVSLQGHDYDNITQKPVRGISINLVDSSGNIVVSTETDENGNYEIEAPNVGSYSIEVVAELGNDQDLPNYISVRDNFTASDDVRDPELTSVYRYTVLPIQQIKESLVNINFNATLNWNSSLNTYDSGRNSPVFVLLDQAYDMQVLLKNWKSDYEFSPLYIFWNENNVAEDGVWWNGEISSSSFAGHGFNGIFVRSDDEVNIDEYDRTIIGHELGHFVLVNLSRDETLGGSHSMTQAMDMRQSFSEGFASYFSWLLTASEFLIDSDGKKNGTTNQQNIFLNIDDQYNKGWYYENVNSDILKTITTGNESYTLEGQGSNFVFDVLHDEMNQSDAFISIHSFIGNSIKKDNTFTSEFQTYLLNKGISSISEWGKDETYNDTAPVSKNGLDHTYLPLYSEIKINETGIACLNDTISGSGNRLGIIKYYKLISEEESDGGHFLNWSSTDGPSFIWSWNATQTADIAGGGSDTLSDSRVIDMAIGTQIIGISFYGNRFPGADEMAPTVESGCITFSITN